MADPEKAMDAGGNDADTEEVEEEEVEMVQNKIANQLLKNPDMLAALQGKLHAMTLPPPVKRRVKALKKLQLACTHIEAKFYEEVHALECKYHEQYLPLYEKRSHISNGDYEPNDDECEWPSDDELSEEVKSKLKLEDNKTTEGGDGENQQDRGIPDFWLTIFKNVDMLAEMVQEHDEPILKHLTDVRVRFTEANPMGFVLDFCFSSNDYFTNQVLTKEYEMKCVPEETDPFSFEGPEIYKCKGCTVDWKKGKNVTVKTIKKKQKHKSRGSVRTVTKTVQNDSFFNFFSPPSVPDDPEADVDEETQALLTADFEIGHYIRERIIPRAVLYFTGEALEEDEFEEEEEDGEEGEEGEEEDEEEEDDADYKPKTPAKGTGGGQGQGQGQNPAECKQQ